MGRYYFKYHDFAEANIDRYCKGCAHRTDGCCRYKLEPSLCRDFTCLFRKEHTSSGGLDHDNPRNIKCENCRHFEKPLHMKTSKKGICHNPDASVVLIEYWKKRDCFEWR